MSLQFKKNKHLPASARTIIIIIVFLVLAICAVLGYFAFRMKSIYQNISSGRNDLYQALVFMDRGEFELANKTTKQAIDSFEMVSSELSNLEDNFFIKKLAKVNDDFKNLRYIASSAEVLSRSAKNSFALVSEFESLISGQKFSSFSELSSEDKALILKKLYESQPEIQGIKANLDLALFYLEKNQDGYFSKIFSSRLDEFKEQLRQASSSLASLVSLAALVPVLSGYPEEVSYLILLQNNNELRPTGGFIGTYGILTVYLGDIKRLETHDSYHLDMPASLNKNFKIEAPEPIKKYLNVDRWFFRDANWSPDWPSSAQNVQRFYQEEMRAAKREAEIIPLSGVIALTPKLISDLMTFTGDIEVNGQKYSADNFTEILQYEVEIAFRQDGISEWDRKNVIADILAEMKNKLFALNSKNWKSLAKIFSQNIEEKNILFYLNKETYRKVSANLNWGGEIRPADLDYLMVVDANLAAFKTDRVMDKKIKYHLSEEDNGLLKARVELDYKNNGWYDWQTTRYRSFTRIYQPLKVSLINKNNFAPDSFLSAEELNIAHPKNYFGSFVSIDPGSRSTMIIEYYLPRELSNKLKNENKYSIVLQKQAGNNSSFAFTFKFKKDIKSFYSSNTSDKLEKLNSRELHWSADLNTDRYLEIDF